MAIARRSPAIDELGTPLPRDGNKPDVLYSWKMPGVKGSTWEVAIEKQQDELSVLLYLRTCRPLFMYVHLVRGVH